MGEKPTRGKPWNKCRSILMPFNLDVKHWIAVELDLVNCEVRCYDCNVNSFKIDDFLQHIRPVSRMIPLLLRQSGMFSHLMDMLRDSWFVTRVDNAPQSKTG